MSKKKRRKYKAAVIGIGNIGWRYDYNVDGRNYCPLTHTGAYLADPRTELIGGCSPDVNDRSDFEKHYGIQTFSNVDDILAKAKPDIVSICSPTELHFRHVCQCLEAKIPMIWLEKPPTLTYSELERLINKQKDGESIIVVNYTRRFLNSYQKLREVLRNETLGKPVAINLNYSKGLLVNGSHIIDTAFMIVGDNEKFELECIISKDNFDSPSFVFRFAKGLPVYVIGYDVPYHCRDITVTFERGRVSITQEGLQSIYEERVEQEFYPGFYRLKNAPSNPLQVSGFDQATRNALNNLIAAYENKAATESNLITAQNTQYLLDTVLNKCQK